MPTTRASATCLPAARQRPMSSRVSFTYCLPPTTYSCDYRTEITSASFWRESSECPSTNSSTYGRAAAIPAASGA